MTLRYPDLESVKKEIETEINGYINSIAILGSLRDYLRNIKIECYIETKIEKKGGGFKTPDLLIHSDDFLLVDHKYTESRDRRTLGSKVEEMKEYESAFVFAQAGRDGERTVEFEPEIVMLTPQNATRFFARISGCPITWGYELDEVISINQSIRSVKDSKIPSLFDPILLCPKSEDVAKYKFIISNAPLPYTASQVYTVLWTLWRPPRARALFTPEFEVQYENVLDMFNNLFPPWVSKEIKQLNASRLREALLLLQDVGWIRWLERERRIIVYRSKGKYIADLFPYLIDHNVKVVHAAKVKEYEKKLKETKVEEVRQKKISDWLASL